MKSIDLSSNAKRSPEKWRSATTSASKGWYDTGTFGQPPISTASQLAASATKAPTATYAEGMLVSHNSYGIGKVTSISGNGALRKIKIRFAKEGERTFLADKVTLSIVQKG